jgi:hypothetical protein
VTPETPQIDGTVVLVFSALAFIAACAVIISLAVAIARVFARASQGPGQMTVTLLLTMITLACIVAFAVTTNDTLLTLAATGIGALAGAVTAIYKEHGTDDDGTGTP